MQQNFEGLASSLQDVSKQGKKIRNRGSATQRNPNEIKPSEYKEIPPIPHRKKSRTKSKIELREKIEIVHEVLIQLLPLNHVARKHRVCSSWVGKIVKKVKDKPKLLSELIASQDEKRLLTEQVSEAIVEMHQKKEGILRELD